MGVLMLACSDDSGPRFELNDAEPGPNIRLTFPPEFSFVNFADLSSAKLQFDLSVTSSNIQTMEIRATYFSFDLDSLGNSYVMSSFTQAELAAQNDFIQGISYSAAELAAGAGFSGAGDLSGGDQFIIAANAVLTNGLIFPDTILQGTPFENVNIAPSIISGGQASEFLYQHIAFVACPTQQDLWIGDYSTAVSEVNNFCGLLDCSSTRDATITFIGNPEPFRYSMSSHDAGLWGSFSPDSFDAAGFFFDICLSPVQLPSPSGGFGDHQQDPNKPSPPRTSEGLIVINWCNFFNPVCGTTTYTPK